MGRTATPLTENADLTALERSLLDDFQRDLPLVGRPFQAMAEVLASDESEVLSALGRLRHDGRVSRVGPVFRPHAVGTSTLAAMAVPEQRLEAVAEQISTYPEVNHNYEREHAFNLWFVVTAADEAHLQRVLADMEATTGLPVMSLPMLEAYHIDLGFRLQWEPRSQGDGGNTQRSRGRIPHPAPRTRGNALESDHDRRLVAAIQQGLPLVSRPFAAVAEQVGVDESWVLQRLGQWLADGVISRFGVVVRHRRLGYRANAMVVWDVPDEEVSELGYCLGGYDFVTLCYRRPRRLPQWPYNLFCMIHGQDRASVVERVEWVVAQCGLQHIPHRLLFSSRSFKQRGAHYQGGSDTRGSSSRRTAKGGEAPVRC